MRASHFTWVFFVLFSCGGGETHTSATDAGDNDGALAQDGSHESGGSSSSSGGGSSGSSSGGDAAMSTSSSGSTPDSGPDGADGADGSSGSPVVCGGNGSGGTVPTDGGCMTMILSDYCSITCSCPEGTCQCQGGGSTRTVPFTGCPSCPSDPMGICNFQ